MAFERRGCALLLALALATVPAWAEPTAAQKETARGLMAEGRELRERGDLDGALKRFGAADLIMGVPTTGYEIAVTQAQQGRLVEARETLRRVLSLPQRADDPEPFEEARGKARTLEQQLLKRIASLRFVVSGAAAGISLEVDGQMLPRAAQGLPLRVNPGRHEVVARVDGRELRRTIDAGEGQTISVPLVFEPASSAPPAQANEPAPPAAPATASANRRARPALAYAAGGIGLAGVVVGGVTGISAISHKNNAQKGCVNGKCPPSTWSDLDKSRSMATISTIGFIVGAVGLAVGAGSLLLSRKAPSEQALLVAPDVTPSGARLQVAGRF